MFNLLCDGQGGYSSAPRSSIGQFGGPILYLVLQILFAFAVLVYVDSGAPVPAFLQRGRIRPSARTGAPSDEGEDVLQELNADVLAEKQRVQTSGDMLRVMNLSKRYPGAPKGQLAVDDVTFGTQLGESFALIGPNGAGKTTCFATIRGVVSVSAGLALSSRIADEAGTAEWG
jgi:ABC-type glutathione transport system ATPase component